MNNDRTQPGKTPAVFLSYAREDTAAARRIAEALRAFGINVWFDQSDLRGGDAWDQKIRAQINDCALFLPMISSHTQNRLEGYFRIEWKLAAQRTHAMADARPFLIPIVIDATADTEAHVPAEFKTVQWTRLPKGEATETFVQRIQALLACGLVAGGDQRFGSGLEIAEQKPGDRISHYKLVQQIGEGGCGIVWMVEQEQPVRRRVALKVIKLGMDTKEVIARFEAERQALAMMDHPNIAKVLDAGATDTGRPFFVMELVRGIRITDYCDQHNLPTEERLKLFSLVCHAVQHAHQKGIIHRDLKPSNILVTVNDGVAMPKVIDFGIAKATLGRLTDRTMITAFQQFIGTPAYMSPEQAEMSSLDIDTRSDIYSLGVLLYELLTGATPFESQELMKIGLDEMRRQIREVEPPRPSARLSTMEHVTQSTTAERRHTDVPKLLKLIRGDLDWIVMRCLDKDRTRRYDTAASIAQDLERHLNHVPIVARPAGATYRFRKLVRRNRLAFAAIGAVAMALIFGLAGSVSQAMRAQRAERIAASEAERANREAEVAKAVNDFLVSDLLRQADSRAQADAKVAPNPDLKVREALDRAGEKVGSRFKDQPLIEAAVRDAIGSAYIGVGDFVNASLHHERALSLREHALGAGHADTLMSMSNLAAAYYFQGKSDASAALYARTFEIRKRVVGAEHPDTLTSMFDLASAYHSQGKFVAAAELSARTLEIQKRVFGPEHPATLSSMSNLAEICYSQGKYPEGEALQSQALEIRKRVLGAEHPNTLVSMNNLAGAFRAQGKYPQAEALQIQTWEIQKRVLGAEHPSSLRSMHNLAAVYRAQGKFGEAETLQVQTLEIQRRVLGGEHPQTLISMGSLAGGYRAEGKFAEAAALQAQTLEIQKRVLGRKHPSTLASMSELGHVQLRQRNFIQAEAILRDALTLFEEKPPVSQTFTTRTRLGAALAGQKKFAEAESFLVSGYEGLVPRVATLHSAAKVQLKDALEWIVLLYADWDQPAKAAAWQQTLDQYNAAR